MDLFDTHCHLDTSEFDADRDRVIENCHRIGVNRIVVPAIDAVGWDGLLDLCRRHRNLFPALGLHPVFLDRHLPEHIPALETLLAQEKPVAVGEIGLDYHVPDLDRNAQQSLFESQLEVARNAQLPVILHVRKAHDPVIATLRRIRVKGGIVHAFNGSLQQGRQYMELGFKLGFGGTLTYERSNKIRRLARELPDDAIVLETDAPDMVVSRHHGERNSPEYLPDCLHALAQARDQDADSMARLTTRNACAVLQLEHTR